MKKRFTDIIRDKKNWLSILTLVASIVAVVINFIKVDINLSFQIISLVLILIALEFFVLTVGVFHDIQKDLDILKKQENHVLWRDNHVEEVKQLLRGSKKDFTVIGGTLSYLDVEKSYIKDASEKVTFRLLALDVTKEKVLKQYNSLIERSTNVENLNHLRYFENIENIKMRKMESLPLVYLIASDLNEPDGKIIAIHLFSIGSIRDYPSITITRDNEEMYEIYRTQIESLWKNASPWKSN